MICDECGEKYGKWRGHDLVSWIKAECDWCGQVKEITGERYYGYPKKAKEVNDD